MFETVRKAMLIGLGAADMAAERVQKTIDELVERGEMTSDQGKQLYGDVMSRVEERGRMENERIRTQVRHMVKDMGIPDRTQIAVLEARMDTIDHKLDMVLSRLAEEEDATAPRPVT